MEISNVFGFLKAKAIPKCSAVIVAAGSSERMGQDKLLIDLGGMPVIARTIKAFEDSDFIDEIVLVTRNDKLEQMADIVKRYSFSKVSKVISGGDTRAESCLAGACAVKKNAKLIAIHDGARPFVSDKLIKNCIFAALEFKAAVPGVKVNDTMKTTSDGIISGDIDRNQAVRVQTPQVFNADLIKGALTYVVSKKLDVTDDSSAVEYLGVKSRVVQGDLENIKLTNPHDLKEAELILKNRG